MKIFVFLRTYRLLGRLLPLSAAASAVTFVLAATPAWTAPSDVATSGTSAKQGSQDAAAKVWTYLFSPDSSPETGGPQPMRSKSGSGMEFQGAQVMWIGGSQADGGLMNLKTADVIEVACANGNVKATPFCQKNKDIAKKSCDAASKIFGVPSTFLICAYAASANYTEKGGKRSSSAPGASQDHLNKTETEGRKTAEEGNYKKAREKYEKMINPGKKNGSQNYSSRDESENNKSIQDDGVCYDYANSARQTLNKLEEALLKSNFLTGRRTNCNFFGMFELLAVAQKYGADAANKMIQSGGNQSIQLMENQRSGEHTQYLDELMKCVNKASEKVAAKPYKVGSCDGQLQ